MGAEFFWEPHPPVKKAAGFPTRRLLLFCFAVPPGYQVKPLATMREVWSQVKVVVKPMIFTSVAMAFKS